MSEAQIQDTHPQAFTGRLSRRLEILRPCLSPPPLLNQVEKHPKHFQHHINIKTPKGVLLPSRAAFRLAALLYNVISNLDNGPDRLAAGSHWHIPVLCVENII